MAPSNESVLRLFDDNSQEDSIEASKILLRFASNILTHPTEDKYRRIRLSNDIVQEKLLPVSGALECLFDMGFQEVNRALFSLWITHHRIMFLAPHLVDEPESFISRLLPLLSEIFRKWEKNVGPRSDVARAKIMNFQDSLFLV